MCLLSIFCVWALAIMCFGICLGYTHTMFIYVDNPRIQEEMGRSASWILVTVMGAEGAYRPQALSNWHPLTDAEQGRLRSMLMEELVWLATAPWEAAVAEVARRYREWVDVFEKAHVS